MYNFNEMTDEEIRELINEKLNKKLNFKFTSYRISRKGNLIINNNLAVFDKNLELICGPAEDTIPILKMKEFVANNSAEISKRLISFYKIDDAKFNFQSKHTLLTFCFLNEQFSFDKNSSSYNIDSIDCFINSIIEMFGEEINQKLHDIKRRHNDMITEVYRKNTLNKEIFSIINNLLEQDYNEGTIDYKFSIDKNGYCYYYNGKTLRHEVALGPGYGVKLNIEYDERGVVNSITPAQDIAEYSTAYENDILKVLNKYTFSHKKNVPDDILNSLFRTNFKKSNLGKSIFINLNNNKKDIKTISCKMLPGDDKTKFDNGYIEFDTKTDTYNLSNSKIIELVSNYAYFRELEKIGNSLLDGLFFIRNITGNGLLLGDTKCEIKKDNISFDYDFPYMPTDNKTKWKTLFQKEIKNIQKIIIQEKEKNIREQQNQFENLRKSFIYFDVFNFISLNENYITENAVVQALRGTHIQLDTKINLTQNSGKYNCYDKEEIIHCINKLVNFDFLFKRKISGTYGKFYILKIENDDGLAILKPNLDKKCYKISEINKKIKENEKLSDCESYIYFKHNINKKDLKNYINSLSCLTKGFVSLYMDEYLEYVKNAPESFKKLICLKKKTEEDAFLKKCFMRIEKALK